VSNIQLITSSIIGAPKESGFPSVGLIEIQIGSKIAICTGTLIAPQLVLLAAHCVKTLTLATKVRCTFKKASGEKVVRLAETWAFPRTYNLSSLETGDFYSRLKGSSKDFALLKLTQPILDIPPSPILPFSTFIDFVESGVIASLKAVGYGRFSYIDEVNAEHSKVKRSADFSKFTIFRNAEMLQIFPSLTTKSLLDSERVVATALGDSGGPYFAKVGGVRFLIATLSSVTTDTSAPPKTLYSVANSAERPFKFFHKHPEFADLFGQSVSSLGLAYVKSPKPIQIADLSEPSPKDRTRRRRRPSDLISIDRNAPHIDTNLKSDDAELTFAANTQDLISQNRRLAISAGLSLGLVASLMLANTLE